MSIERPISGRASRRARRKELDDAAVPGDRHCKRKVREKKAAIGLAQREEAGAGVMLGKKSGRLEKDPAQAIPLRTLSPSIPAGAR